jgi:hypothetical protein
VQALKALDRSLESDVFYSSVVTLSKSDAKLLREMIVKFLEQASQIITESQDEEARVLSLDFFSLTDFA